MIAALEVGPETEAHESFRRHDNDAILIDSVVKRFANHVAVSGISLRVPRGTIYGVLGPNGAGKTTTIRMVLNILAPDSGSIFVLGHPNDRTTLRRRIGYLPEERGLYRKMPVRRALCFLAELRGLEKREAMTRIDGWLERFELRGQGRDWGSARVEELSRGMQQKVQFIGTVLHDPDLIILDEPFSGLDPMNAQALKDAVLELRTRGKTVVFSTHVMDNAERMCDAVCIIARGSKVLDGTISQIREQHAARYLLITCEAPHRAMDILRPPMCREAQQHGSDITVEIESGVSAERVLQTLVSGGARVTRFEPMQPSLHQIFVETVGAMGVEEGVTGHG